MVRVTNVCRRFPVSLPEPSDLSRLFEYEVGLSPLITQRSCTQIFSEDVILYSIHMLDNATI